MIYLSAFPSHAFDVQRRVQEEQSEPQERALLLQGTLDVLVLRTLAAGRYHGHGVALAIEYSSDGAILVDHGSLYPALQRLEAAGWIEAEWGVSENNRRARFYELTRAGRKQLEREVSEWRRLVAVMTRVLGARAEWVVKMGRSWRTIG